MSKDHFSGKLSLQITPRMLDQLHQVSEYEEMSLSELTRWAIRERLRTGVETFRRVYGGQAGP